MRDLTELTNHQKYRIWASRSMHCCALALAALSASVPATAAPARSNAVEDYIAFAPEMICMPTERMQSLLDALVPLNSDGTVNARPTQRIPRALARYAPSLRRQHDAATTTGSITLNAPWHGLRLTSFSHWVAPASDHQGVSLRFADAPDRVRAALNRMGIAMPASGEIRVGNDIVVTMSLSPDGQGAILACSA